MLCDRVESFGGYFFTFSPRVFVDTNVWLYAFIDGQDLHKSQQARILLERHSNIAVSTQVINEICVNLLKKKHCTFPHLRGLIDDFYSVCTVVECDRMLLLTATGLCERHMISYWDGLIVTAALASGASVLYSEDMHGGFVVEQKLTIVNPFQHG